MANKKPKKKKLKIKLNGRSLHHMFELKQLKGQSDLEELDLHFNYIEEICGIDHLVNLKKLNLSCNGISKISGLEKLVNLESLDISSPQRYFERFNELQYVRPGDRKYFTPLKKIEGIENQVNLLHLDLSRNEIKDISGLKQCKKLEKLYLRVNNITSINVLNQLKNLQMLSLAHNNFKLIETKKVKALKYLKKCDLPLYSVVEECVINENIKIQFCELDYSKYWFYDPKRWYDHRDLGKKSKTEFLALIFIKRKIHILTGPDGTESGKVYRGGYILKSVNEFKKICRNFHSWIDSKYKTTELQKYIRISVLQRLSKTGDLTAKQKLDSIF